MPFFKSLKRAFGFSGDDTSTTEDDGTISSVDRKPYINPFTNSNAVKTQQDTPNTEQTIVTPQIEDVNISIPDSIINNIADLINASLPQVIKNTVDVEAEKKYLFDMLNPSFEEYVKTITSNVLSQNIAFYNIEREKLSDQIDEMQSAFSQAKAQKNEIQNAQLSFDRQKRALTDKIAELEKSNLKNESDAEQYLLENKSLFNKLKALQVRYDKAGGNVDNDTAIDDDTIQLQLTIDELNEKIKILEANQASTISSPASEGVDISSAMIEEMRKRLSEANIDVERKNREIVTLREKLQLSNEELESVREELSELNSNLEIVNEIQEQLNTFDDFKKKKRAKIDSLTESIKRRDDEIAKLSNIIASLRATIEENVTIHANAIKELTTKFEQKAEAKKEALSNSFDMTALDELTIVADSNTPRYNKVPTTTQSTPPVINEKESIEPVKQPVISAIDDSPHSDNWLMPTPPTFEEPTKKEKEQPIPPKQDIKTTNAAQMSLF